MSKLKLAFVFTFGVLFFACEKDKTEVDFSIIPVKGTNGEYQYIDLSQKGKIVINPQFGEAHVFRSGLARVKTSGDDGKFGYIDKKGKFAINPVYSFGQDFSDDVAWVQLEDQPPILIDKSGKTLLQIDSLVEATPFSNGIAGISVYSKGQVLPMFIDKKGESVATVAEKQAASLFINNDRYAVKNKVTGKWGYKDKKGEAVINEQFDEAYMFFDGMAVVRNGDKWGAIDKQGNFIINPQYDTLFNDSDGLFIVKVGKKYGWVNKKGEIVINPQFDNICGGFYGNKLAPVQMGDKFGYIDKNGQIAINPQFDVALPFNGDYAMVANVNDGMKIGFIYKKGNFIVAPLYEGNLGDVIKYTFATTQNVFNLSYAYESVKAMQWEIIREIRLVTSVLDDYRAGTYFGGSRRKLDLTLVVSKENFEIRARGSLHKIHFKEMWTFRCKSDNDTITYDPKTISSNNPPRCQDGSELDSEKYKSSIEKIHLWTLASEKDPNKVEMSVYSKNDSAYLDGNNDFITSLSAITTGTTVATLAEGSARRLACGQTAAGVEDICIDGKPAVKLRPRSAYDELAKPLIIIHNRFIDSPDSDKIVILFDDEIDFDDEMDFYKISSVMSRVRDAGFFKMNVPRASEAFMDKVIKKIRGY